MIGCGADANPKPRGTIELVQAHGIALADAVDRALPGAAPIAPALHTAYGTVDLPFADAAARERWRRQLDIDEVYLRRHAALMEETIRRDGHLPVAQRDPVQVWRFGSDLALVGLGGEVVVDYAIRLAREYPKQRLWVVRLLQRRVRVCAVSPRSPRGRLRRRRRDDLLRAPGAVHRRGRGSHHRQGPPADARPDVHGRIPPSYDARVVG